MLCRRTTKGQLLHCEPRAAHSASSFDDACPPTGRVIEGLRAVPTIAAWARRARSGSQRLCRMSCARLAHPRTLMLRSDDDRGLRTVGLVESCEPIPRPVASGQQVPMKPDHLYRVGKGARTELFRLTSLTARAVPTRSVANGGHGAQSAPLPPDETRGTEVAGDNRNIGVAFMSPLVSEDGVCVPDAVQHDAPHALLQPARTVSARRGAPLIRDLRRVCVLLW